MPSKSKSKPKPEAARSKTSPITIGIIGGSGLYSMHGLTDIREVRVKTPFGDPSDDHRNRHTGREARRISRAARAGPSYPPHGNQFPRQYLRDETARRRANHFCQRGGLAAGRPATRENFWCRISSSTAPAAHLHIFRRWPGRARHVSTIPTCAQLSTVLADASEHCEVKVHRARHLRVHRRPAIFHAGRGPRTSATAFRNHRHDQRAPKPSSPAKPKFATPQSR